MLSFSEELVITIVIVFLLPPLLTGYLARGKGRNFWIWSGLGSLFCGIGYFGSLFLFQGVKEAVGALSGPLITLFLEPKTAVSQRNLINDARENVKEHAEARLKLSNSQIVLLFLVALLIGFQSDLYCFHAFQENMSFVDINFIISVPLFLLLMIILIYFFKLNNKVAITALTMSLSALFMIITLYIYDLKEGPGHPSEFWGLAYFIGLLPALFIGCCYGLYLSSKIDNGHERTIKPLVE